MQKELKVISDLLSTDTLTSKKLDQINQILEQYTSNSKVTIQFLQQLYDQLSVIPKDKNYEGCETKALLIYKLDELKTKIANQILEIKKTL